MNTRSIQATVLLFAGARDLIGLDQIQLDVAPDISAADFLHQLGLTFPALAPLVPVSRLAANGSYLAGSTNVDLTAELAFIPPVSGG
jgi:molybdopterin converting factor small subunit